MEMHHGEGAGGIARECAAAPFGGGSNGFPECAESFRAAAKPQEKKTPDVNGVVLRAHLEVVARRCHREINQVEGGGQIGGRLFQLEFREVLSRERKAVFVVGLR